MRNRRPTRSTLTINRIMATAERLIAERGLDAASMRILTQEAKVNLAAVNYHFGSKEKLLVQIFTRRLRPINEARVLLLDAAERAVGSASPTLETILRSFISPALLPHGDEAERRIIRLLQARLSNEPGGFSQQLFAQEMEPILHRFTGALTRCLPEIPREELFWRLHVAGGALALALHQREADQDDPAAVERLIGFLAAGFRSSTPAVAMDSSVA